LLWSGYVCAMRTEEETALRNRIENELGLEPGFFVIDTKREGNENPLTRFEVFDAEMTSVCTCENEAYAELIRDLLGRATN
jgi:hypothetical protein